MNFTFWSVQLFEMVKMFKIFTIWVVECFFCDEPSTCQSDKLPETPRNKAKFR